MNKLIHVGIAFASGALCAWLAARLTSRSAAGIGDPSPSVEERLVAVDARIESQQRLFETQQQLLGTLLRRQTGAPAAATVPAQTPTPAPPEASTVTVDLAAEREAESLVDQAIDSGRWSEGDRARFRALRGRLGSAATGELVRRLVVATNEQRIRLDPNVVPPF